MKNFRGSFIVCREGLIFVGATVWGARANLVNSLILYLREISTNDERQTNYETPTPPSHRKPG